LAPRKTVISAEDKSLLLMLDSEAAFRLWEIHSSFDSAEDCRSAKNDLEVERFRSFRSAAKSRSLLSEEDPLFKLAKVLKSEYYEYTDYQQARDAVCIATDDPRLR
jgi:hypothetical protein